MKEIKQYKTVHFTKSLRILSMLVTTLIVLPLATAIPVPQGISGMVYELDGVTSVGSGVSFSVTNLNSGKQYMGTTNHGTAGRYSVSLSGSSGDQALIQVWNDWHSSNRTVTLTGVLRGVDLFLNMTPPPLPPEFITLTLPVAYEDTPYSVAVIVEDINKDLLNFSIYNTPPGMTINKSSGQIRWNPLAEYVGNYSPTVTVTDGKYRVNHTYQLTVVEVNDPPKIISTPPSSATLNNFFQYVVLSEDEENETLTYSLETASPIGATINNQTGLLTWTPRSIGQTNFTISVFDGENTVNHSFTVFVGAAPSTIFSSSSQPSASEGGGGGGAPGLPIVRSSELENQTISRSISLADAWIAQTYNSDDLELLANALAGQVIITEHADLDITLLDRRPSETVQLDALTYQYLSIEGDHEETVILFAVSPSWIAQHQLSASDLSLRRYVDGAWQVLDTQMVGLHNRILYLAKTPGFSYFAIAANKPASETDYTESVLRLPYIIKGIIHRWGRFAQYPENTPVTLENLNSSWKFTVFTGLPEDSGGYLAAVPGIEGDVIRITVEDYSIETTLGSKGTLEYDFVKEIFGSSFDQITGNAIFGSTDTRAVPIAGVLTLLGLIGSAMFIRLRHEKRV